MTVADLARDLRNARVFDLEHPRRFGDPVHPPHRPGTLFTLHRRHEPGLEEARTSASGMIFTAEHAGTHIDALCHQALSMTLYGGVHITPEVQTPTGFTKLGIDTVPPIIARGVMIDLAAHRGSRLPERSLVDVSDLEAAQKAQQTEIRTGDVVLVRTGTDTLWDDPDRYLNGAGISREASEWLADKKVLAVGSDNVAWDLAGYVDERLGVSLPGHVVLLVHHGVYIIENLNLAELSAAQQFEFIFVCLPLKIKGGTASPVRPLALVPSPSDKMGTNLGNRSSKEYGATVQNQRAYSPVHPDLYRQSESRVFIVGAEPVGGRPQPSSKDMGEWFRLARENNYWNDPHFYHGTLLRLRAVLGLPADNLDYAERDLDILKHLRYIDLKATEGSGSVPDPPIHIEEWVRANIGGILEYWKSDKPEVTVLMGWAAQRVFERIVRPELLRANLAYLKRVGLPHPLQYWHDVGGLVNTKARLMPLSEKLNYWGPNSKEWKSGIP
ncbi:MAG: cyclase family protein [bacterium]